MLDYVEFRMLINGILSLGSLWCLEIVFVSFVFFVGFIELVLCGF